MECDERWVINKSTQACSDRRWVMNKSTQALELSTVGLSGEVNQQRARTREVLLYSILQDNVVYKMSHIWVTLVLKTIRPNFLSTNSAQKLKNFVSVDSNDWVYNIPLPQPYISAAIILRTMYFHSNNSALKFNVLF